MNILQRLLTKLTPKPTHVTVAGHNININNITKETWDNIAEIERLIKTDGWKNHVKRMDNDPTYREQTIKRCLKENKTRRRVD